MLVMRLARSPLWLANPPVTVFKLSSTDASCWSRPARVLDTVLAESISWLTSPLRWSTVVVNAPRPLMIWATCCCLPWVMVARDSMMLLSALALVWVRRWPAVFWTW